MILLQVSRSCEHGRVSDAAFAPHLPRSAADKHDALVSNSVFLRKAAQITAVTDRRRKPKYERGNRDIERDKTRVCAAETTA